MCFPLHIKSAFVLILFYFIGIVSYSQKRFEPWQPEDPKFVTLNNTFKPKGIVQDKYGFMWFGSDEGLFRYDGIKFQNIIYGTADSSKLLSLSCSPKLVDSRGWMWISTNRGLSCYKIAEEKFINYPYNDSLFNDVIVQIQEDTKHNIWIASIGRHNLTKWDAATGNLFSYALPDSISNRRTFGLAIHPNGKMYVAMDQFIGVFNPQTSSYEKFIEIRPPGLKPFDVSINQSITGDKLGNIFIGLWWPTATIILNTANNLYTVCPHIEDQGAIISLTNKSETELWAGCTKGLGVFNKVTHTFHFFQHEPDNFYSVPPASNVWTIFTDKKQCTWFLMNDKIIKYDPDDQITLQFNLDKILDFSIPKGQSFHPNTVLFDDRDKNFYISTWNGDGFYRVNILSGKIVSCAVKEKLNDDELISHSEQIISSSKNELWTFNYHQLMRYDKQGNRLNLFPLSTSITGQNHFGFIHVMEDSKQNLWLGTMRHGVVRVNPITNSCTYFPSLVCDSSVPNSVNFIKPQFEDEEGNIWFDSFCGIIIYYPATQLFEKISFDSSNGFYNDGRGIIKSHSGIIWRITSNDGLQRFNKNSKKFEKIKTNYEASFKDAENLLEDVNGYLWFDSQEGIFRFDPEKNHISSFKKEFGYDIGSVILGYDAKRNELYTGDGGTLKITPLDKLFSKSEPPAIVFTSIHVNEKEFPFTTNLNEVKNITLNHQQNFLSFEFAALNFSYSNFNQYAHKLDGIDDDWVQSGNRNYAAYSNLHPGTYTFHVKGSNNNGVWNEKGKSIIITIVPAWWQTGLFRAAVLIFIVNFIFLSTRFYYRQKLKLQQEQLEKQKAVERIRSKISSDIHDEIGAGLTKISLMAQRLKMNFDNKKDIDAGMVNKITESSKEIVGNLSQIIWTANPQHDNLASLLAYMRNYASHFFEDTGIQCSIQFPADVPEQHIHPDVKHNLFLVIKESLNNIVKHAHASNVQIHFQYDNNQYAFIITDDGIGMDNISGRDFGNGLINMKNRMQAVHGRFEITSEKNKGTAVYLKGKIDY